MRLAEVRHAGHEHLGGRDGGVDLVARVQPHRFAQFRAHRVARLATAWLDRG